MKTCSKCRVTKDVSDFGRDAGRKDGLCPHCRKCRHEFNMSHRSEKSAYNREYGSTHREEKKAYGVVYRSARRAEASARTRAWERANPERVARNHHIRRAREIGAEGSYTKEEWAARVAQYNGLCAYCGVAPGVAVEHKIPLSRGGSNYIENIVPACKSCNSRKRSRTAEEFRAEMAA